MSSCYQDDIDLETHQLGRKIRRPIGLPLPISVLGGDVLSFYVATLAQSQPNSSERADSLAALPDDRYPIREIFFGCCASSGRAKRKEHGAKRKKHEFFVHGVFPRLFFLSIAFALTLTLILTPLQIDIEEFMFM